MSQKDKSRGLGWYRRHPRFKDYKWMNDDEFGKLVNKDLKEKQKASDDTLYLFRKRAKHRNRFGSKRDRYAHAGNITGRGERYARQAAASAAREHAGMYAGLARQNRDKNPRAANWFRKAARAAARELTKHKKNPPTGWWWRKPFRGEKPHSGLRQAVRWRNAISRRRRRGWK